MTSKTVVQYTPEQTAQLVAEYQLGISVEAIATSMGKSVRSVIAKLAREGVYVAKPKTTQGTATLRKAQLIEAIAARLSVPVEKLESLEKATKEALELLVNI